MTWHTGPLLAFDTETTGVDAHTCRIVQVGLARVVPGEGVVSHLWLLDPGIDIPEQASAIHGITTARCQSEGERPEKVLRQVRDLIVEHLGAGLPLIAYNASYDCTLLEAELTRLGLETVTDLLGTFAPVIDPFVIDKAVDPYRKGKRTLEVACEHYDVRLDGAHDAGHDAMAAARLAWRLGQRHPDIAGMPLDVLHDTQVAWAKAQADSLRAYFDRTGKQHDGVDGTWPVRQRTAVAA